MTAVTAHGLGVRFLIDRAQKLMTPGGARFRRVIESWGLRNLDLAIGPSEAVALLGSSGAGKTTLLRAIAGVHPADEGSITVHGRVGSLLSIDAGLTAPLTGRENTHLLGVLAGSTRAESRALVPHVEREAALGRAFDLPVGGWSQGMRARLGFAVAVATGPDVLLLDEVHEALDHEYRERVAGYARDLLDRGGIVIAAGHDHPLLEQICTRAVWLDEGQIRDDGAFATVQRAYLA